MTEQPTDRLRDSADDGAAAAESPEFAADPRSAIGAAAALIWPAPAVLRWGVRGDRPPADMTAVSEHVFFPTRPMLTPAGHAAGFGAFMARARGALPFYRRAAHLGLAAGLGSGGAQRVWRGRLFVDVPVDEVTDYGTGITAFIADLIGQRVTTAIAIGAVRANRKPVIYAFDDKGHLVAYAKLAWNPLTAILNANEAAALDEVTNAAPRTFDVPRTMFHGLFNGAPLLVLEPLAIPFTGRSTPVARLVPAMLELASIGGLEVAPLTSGAWWTSVQQRLAAAPDSALKQRLTTMMARIVETDGQRPVTLGRWHGDWTKWNMAARHHALQLWDFERSSPWAPLGFDSIHLSIHAVLERNKATPAEMVDLLSSAAVQDPLAAFTDQEAARSLVVSAYLVEISLRAIADSAQISWPRVERRANWLLDILQRQVG